jgi:hypothetical protein
MNSSDGSPKDCSAAGVTPRRQNADRVHELATHGIDRHDFGHPEGENRGSKGKSRYANGTSV